MLYGNSIGHKDGVTFKVVLSWPQFYVEPSGAKTACN